METKIVKKKKFIKTCDKCKHEKALIKNTQPCSKCSIIAKNKFNLKKEF